METTTPLVSDHGGVILRFLGDSIMAAFGPPIARTTEKEIRQDAVNAVSCALAIQAGVIALNRRLEQRGWPLISMRIGVLSGRVVGGSIGTAKRFEYNVHGDTVNTASRLESFDKEAFDPDYFKTPCRILIGESTLRLVDDTFHTELVGEFRLKGKTQTIRIHRVHGYSDEKELTSSAALPEPSLPRAER
jgi:adenylate cyclase